MNMMYLKLLVADPTVTTSTSTVAGCSEDLLSILGIVRNRIIPIIQIGIIAALVILLILDFGKAVMAGKEDEIKTAQKLAIKRIVYALVVFFVPLIVNVVIGLVAPSGNVSDDYNNEGAKPGNALTCWKDAKTWNTWG